MYLIVILCNKKYGSVVFIGLEARGIKKKCRIAPFMVPAFILNTVIIVILETVAKLVN